MPLYDGTRRLFCPHALSHNRTGEWSVIELRIAEDLELNSVLEVGAQTVSITVTAETPLLWTASGSIGQVVDSKRLAELPMSMGLPFGLTQAYRLPACYNNSFPSNVGTTPSGLRYPRQSLTAGFLLLTRKPAVKANQAEFALNAIRNRFARRTACTSDR